MIEAMIQELARREEGDLLNLVTAGLCVLSKHYRTEPGAGGGDAESWYAINRAWAELDQVRDRRLGERAFIAGEQEALLLARQRRRRTCKLLTGGA